MPEEKNISFDEGAREALTLLLENYWILREDKTDQYHLIRQYEPVLRTYFFEKCGWRLIQNPLFYKLEKIPSEPKTWMGILGFQQPRDYVLLCCILAFSEENSVDDQFLLSDLCESILALYPREAELGEGLNWENYDHRRSLVRALKFAVDVGVIRLVDGDSEQFAMSRDSEALYEVTIMARYFLRTYPSDLHQYQSLQELLSVEHFDEEATIGTGRRVRVYRQLLLNPAYNVSDARPEDFAYLRAMHKRLREELESHTGLQFELYKDCAMLTSPERSYWCKQLFPIQQSGIHGVALHFARFCRDERRNRSEWGNAFSRFEFEKLVSLCRTLYGAGWTKEYRELGISRLATDLLLELMDWDMAAADRETGLIEFRPPFWRLAGRYPDDYKAASST